MIRLKSIVIYTLECPLHKVTQVWNEMTGVNNDRIFIFLIHKLQPVSYVSLFVVLLFSRDHLQQHSTPDIH